MKKFLFLASLSALLSLNSTASFASHPDPKQYVGNYEVIDAMCTGQTTPCTFSKVTIFITVHFAGLTIKIDETWTGVGESNCSTSDSSKYTVQPERICHERYSSANGIHTYQQESIEKAESGYYKLEFSSSSSDVNGDNLWFFDRVLTLKKID